MTKTPMTTISECVGGPSSYGHPFEPEGPILIEPAG